MNKTIGQRLMKWVIWIVAILVLIALVWILYKVGIIRYGSSSKTTTSSAAPTSGNAPSSNFLSRLFKLGDSGIPAGFTQDQLSPNFRLVRVSAVATGRYGP